jgi:thiol-disulfide isomerase/thioredoxin
MRKLMLALLYTALPFLANLANADQAALEALRDGDMRKLSFASDPQPAPLTNFTDANGNAIALDQYAGQYVLLNFWATWCAPCREEMPTLSALQSDLGGDRFAVVTIATGRNDRAGMERFFAEIGVDNLPLNTDPRQQLARDMGVLGLPVTLILNPEGQEIARLQGGADWASDSARAIIAALIAGN